MDSLPTSPAERRPHSPEIPIAALADGDELEIRTASGSLYSFRLTAFAVNAESPAFGILSGPMYPDGHRAALLGSQDAQGSHRAALRLGTRAVFVLIDEAQARARLETSTIVDLSLNAHSMHPV